MRKSSFTLLLMLVCQLTMAQTAKSVFDDYKQKSGAEYVSVPSMLIQVAANKLKDEKAKDVVRQVKSARVLNMSGCKKSVRKKFVKAIKKLPNNGYDTITNMRSSINDTLIYTLGDDDTLKEVVVLLSGDDNATAVLFTGNINSNSISDLIGLADSM